jgi:hypothetical protein
MPAGDLSSIQVDRDQREGRLARKTVTTIAFFGGII